MYKEAEQSLRRLGKVACVPWDRERRLGESRSASSHLIDSLSIAIRICLLLLPTLGCSEHLGIEEGRTDMSNTGKFDSNIEEKNKNTPDAVMIIQHHYRYLPIKMFSLYIIKSDRVNMVERQQTLKKQQGSGGRTCCKLFAVCMWAWQVGNGNWESSRQGLVKYSGMFAKR